MMGIDFSKITSEKQSQSVHYNYLVHIITLRKLVLTYHNIS